MYTVVTLASNGGKACVESDEVTESRPCGDDAPCCLDFSDFTANTELLHDVRF
jgi:hypothetical protein